MRADMVKHFGAQILKKVVSVTARSLLGTITHVETDDRVAALTFDDGPHPEFTPRLLDVLANHSARATFFVLGERARKFPYLVERVAAEGHAIANHSWDHPSFPLIAGHERRKQIRLCASSIKPYGGTKLFRPPYGHQNLASRFDALRLGYRVIMYDVLAEDWLAREADWMANALVTQIVPGSIVCLHDAIHRSVQAVPQYDRQPMITAVNLALERLEGRFQFVTVPELLRFGPPRLENWYTGATPAMMAYLRDRPAVMQSSTELKRPRP